LNDSKVLTANARERLAAVLGECATAIGVGAVQPGEIDAFGLTAANRLAMERAVWARPCAVDALLIDAFMLDSELPQHSLIDGDAQCLSIAAASVIAKVTRDRIMVEAHRDDERYGFDRHKGYGAPSHLDALRRHGPCGLHRRRFAPVAALLP
jgi:ribonuclease HII